MALTGHKSHAAYLRYAHSDREQAKAFERIGALTTALSFDDIPPSKSTIAS